MKLSQLLDGENPIIHKSWAMGEHLAKSKDNGLWMKYPASYDFSLPAEFDIEKAIADDDGSYFTMPPRRPTYEEIADILNTNDDKKIYTYTQRELAIMELEANGVEPSAEIISKVLDEIATGLTTAEAVAEVMCNI